MSLKLMQSTEEVPEQEETIQEEDIAGEYILSESNVRIYTKEELENLSDEELRLARNEIYARHGRIFSSDAENMLWDVYYLGLSQIDMMNGDNSFFYQTVYKDKDYEKLAELSYKLVKT